jgi:hypothetical protein
VSASSSNEADILPRTRRRRRRRRSSRPSRPDRGRDRRLHADRRARDEAAADAQALGNRWGIDRAGFDDGLVVLFDMESTAACAVRPSPAPASSCLADESQAIFEGSCCPSCERATSTLALWPPPGRGRPGHADDTEAGGGAHRERRLGLIVVIAALGLLGFRPCAGTTSGAAALHGPLRAHAGAAAGLSRRATLLMAGRSTERRSPRPWSISRRGRHRLPPWAGLLTTKVRDRRPRRRRPDPYVGQRRQRQEPPKPRCWRPSARSTTDGTSSPTDGRPGAKTAFDSALERGSPASAGSASRRRAPSAGSPGVPKLVWRGHPLHRLSVPLSGVRAGGALGVVGVVTSGGRVMPAPTMNGARLDAWLRLAGRSRRPWPWLARWTRSWPRGPCLAETPDGRWSGASLGLHEEVEAVLTRRPRRPPPRPSRATPWLPGWYGGHRALVGRRASQALLGSAVPDFGACSRPSRRSGRRPGEPSSGARAASVGRLQRRGGAVSF